METQLVGNNTPLLQAPSKKKSCSPKPSCTRQDAGHIAGKVGLITLPTAFCLGVGWLIMMKPLGGLIGGLVGLGIGIAVWARFQFCPPR